MPQVEDLAMRSREARVSRHRQEGGLAWGGAAFPSVLPALCGTCPPGSQSLSV